MQPTFRRILGIIVIAAFLLAAVNPGSVWAQEPGDGGGDVDIPPDVDLQLFDEFGNPVPLGSEKSSEMLKEPALLVASFVCATNPALGGEFGSLTAAKMAMDACVADAGGTGQIGGALTVYAVSLAEELSLTSDYAGFSGVIGAGSGNTQFTGLSIVNTQANSMLFQGITLHDFLYLNTSGDLTLNDIVLLGGGTENDTGIDISTLGDVALEDVISDDSYDYGIEIDNAANVTLKNIKTRNNSQSGVLFYPDDRINNVTLNQIESTGNGWEGIGFWGYGSGFNNVVATDLFLSSNYNDGLYIGQADNITINNVSSIFNGDDGIDIYDTDQAIIQNVDVGLNYEDGLVLEGSPTGADLVWLDGIDAMHNGENGLDIYSDEGSAPIQYLYINDAYVAGNGINDEYDGAWIGGVVHTSITNSTFLGNYGDQLDIDNNIYPDAIKGKAFFPFTVNIEDVYVDGMGMGYEGIEVSGYGVEQDVSLNNVTVKNTGDDGIFLYYNDQVDVYNVEATNNGWSCDWYDCAGLWLEDNNLINIGDSTFNYNRDAGIWVDNWDFGYSAYNVGINRVEANFNGISQFVLPTSKELNRIVFDAKGIEIYDVYNNVVISNTSTTGNGTGIYAETWYGTIALDQVNANLNRIEGAQLVSFSGRNTPNGDLPTTFYLRCSKFNHNGILRFDTKGRLDSAGLTMIGGYDAVLEGVSAHGNGNYDILAMIGGELVMLEGENCKVEPVVVPQGGSGGACEAQNLNMELSNGDMANLTGLCSGSMTLDGVIADGLPGALPDGSTFQSGLTASLDGDSGLLPEGGSLEVTMAVPEGVDTANLSVLYWDAGAGAWVEVPLAGNESAFSASNGGVVISGVVFNDDGTLSFTVNFSGTFVVVSK